MHKLKQRDIEWDLLPYCQEQGVTVIAHTPFGDDSLATQPRLLGSRVMETLESVAAGSGKTLAQVARTMRRFRSS